MSKLVSLLSKTTRDKLPNITTSQLLSESFYLNSDLITKSDKKKLQIIREMYTEYQVESALGQQISSTTIAIEVCEKLLQGREQETLLLLCLNNKNRIIHTEEIYKGTSRTSVARPKEIFTCALRHGSERIIIAHNHPSGDAEPSEADIRMTEGLLDASEVLGVELLDHIIIGAQRHTSLREETNIWTYSL